MNPLKKIASLFGLGTKSAEYPTVRGSFDIFRDFISFDTNMSQTKALQTYEKSLYVFACVRKIAQKTASINFKLMRIKNTQGDKEEIFVHEALDILYRPNPFQTKTEFYERYMINKLLAGENFVLKVRANGPGTEVVEHWNLRPDRMNVLIDRNDPKLIKGYEFVRSNGRTVFDPEDIIHDAYPSPLDEFGGTSALQAGRVRVETEEFASKYQANFFKNNARPDFILETAGKVSGEQKDEIREAWNKKHQGAKNTGKGAILEGGLKYQQVSISQREMDYIESMKFTRDDILVAFGVPKPIVAITDDVNLANAQTAMEIFLKETIEPEINRLVEKLNEHLIYPEYGDNFYIDYDKSFLPKNEKEDAEIDEILLRSGIKLINEAREERGMEPMEGGWDLRRPISEAIVGGLPKAAGRKFVAEDPQVVFKGRGRAFKHVQLVESIENDIYKNVLKGTVKAYDPETGYDQEKDEAEETPHTDHKYIDEETRGKYYDVVNKQIDAKGDRFKPEVEKFAEGQKQRVLRALNERYEAVEITGADKVKAVRGAFDKKSEDKILAEIAFPFMEEFLRSAGQEALTGVAPDKQFEVTDALSQIMKDQAEEMATEVNGTTVDKLERTLTEGIEAGEGIFDLSVRVEDVYSEYPLHRAETVARTTATAANNLGFIEGYRQSDVVNAKEWIATQDDRTRTSHIHLDSKVIGLDEKFSNGLRFPGDPHGRASEVVNCRCVLAPVFRE